MRVLVVSANRNASPFPVMPFGACVAAEAAAGAGHDVRFLDLLDVSEAPDAVAAASADFLPDVVGLSLRNIDNNNRADAEFFLEDVETLARAGRATEARVVLGGAAMGVMPREIMARAGVDLGVLGRAETVFAPLLDALSSGASAEGLEGVATLRRGEYRQIGFTPGFGGAPPSSPDFRRWIDVSSYKRRMACAPVQTKTGCNFKCVYCTYHRIEGPVHRLKAPEAVADEVASLAGQGFSDIEFVDSVFNAPADHAKEVCRALIRKGRRSRLHCLELNPLGFDDELADLMEKAGFAGIGITLESASEQVLKGLNKGFTLREVNAAADVVARHKIPCAWIFLAGGPGETNATFEETLSFAANRVRRSDVAFFNLGVRIYPGTELERVARVQCVLDAPTGGMLEPVFYLSPFLDEDMLNFQLETALAKNMNFIGIDTFKNPILPWLNRTAHRLGVRPPLWRHTRHLRRGLRMAGFNV